MPTRKNEAYWSQSQQRWQINVQQDGERRTFVSSKKNSQPENKKGKIEAEKKADKWLSDHQLINERIRCSALLDRYLERVQNATGTSNQRQISGHIKNWIRPVIGHRQIAALTKNDLQSVIDKAYASGKLGARSLKGLRGTLMSFLSFCQDEQATRLIVRKLTIPAGARREEKQILDAESLHTLFSRDDTFFRRALRPDWYVEAYRFAVVTGLRPGELCGLEWRNNKGNVITLTKSINDFGETTQGKNKNALRSFALDEYAQSILARQKAKALASNWVFPGPDMDHMAQHNLRAAWHRYCDTHGITTATTPYELRHTFVSLNDEMPDALKKMLVGHSKSMDTDGTYGHRKKGDMEKAAQYVTAALDAALKPL